MRRIELPTGEIINVQTDRQLQVLAFIESGLSRQQVTVYPDENHIAVAAALINACNRVGYFGDRVRVTKPGGEVYLERKWVGGP